MSKILMDVVAEQSADKALDGSLVLQEVRHLPSKRMLTCEVASNQSRRRPPLSLLGGKRADNDKVSGVGVAKATSADISERRENAVRDSERGRTQFA